MTLSEWIEGVRGRPTRSFIYHKMSRQPVQERELAIEHFMSEVPHNLRGDFEAQVFAYGLLAVTPEFWRADCAMFAQGVAEVFRKRFEERGEVATDEQLFDAIELVALVLTRKVETDNRVRRASGIGRYRWLLMLVLAIVVAAAIWYFF